MRSPSCILDLCESSIVSRCLFKICCTILHSRMFVEWKHPKKSNHWPLELLHAVSAFPRIDLKKWVFGVPKNHFHHFPFSLPPFSWECFFFVPPKFETIIKKQSRFTHGCDNGPKRLGLLEWVYGLTYQKWPYFKRVHLFQGLSFWVSMLLVFGDVLR